MYRKQDRRLPILGLCTKIHMICILLLPLTTVPPSHTACIQLYIPSLPSFTSDSLFLSVIGQGTDIKCVFLTLAVLRSRSDAKTMTSAWQLIKLASTSFLHLGANYVRVKRRNTSGGHKSPAEWRQEQAWRPDGRETTTLGSECVLLRRRRAEDGTALDP